MGSIQNVGGNSPIYSPNKVAPKAPATTDAPTSATPNRGADKLELSGASHLLQTLKAGGDVRADKVAALKAAIASESYEDDHKLDIASDKLLDELTNG